MKTVLFGALILAATITGPCWAQDAVDSIPTSPPETAPRQSFQDLLTDAVVFQQQKRFDEASAVLEQIIAELEDSEEVVRAALSQLVYNHLDWDNGTVVEIGSRALRRYPDLQADTIWIPEEVNELYDNLRSQLFGSLTIKKPEGCPVFLNGEEVGTTPYFQQYIEVGEYTLRVTKERRHPYEETIQIEPSGDHTFEEVPLPALKDARYWFTRVGLGGLAAGAIYALVPSDSGTTPEEADPLAGPPDVPGKSF